MRNTNVQLFYESLQNGNDLNKNHVHSLTKIH